jgi:chorismate-pyruvate lyase
MTEFSTNASLLPSHLAHPLDEFYARNNTALPPLQQVEGEEVPEPEKSLLVHDSDMTSTLETHHGGPVELEVLGRKRDGDLYFREVVLRMIDTRVPVEFGAIKIHLDLFPAAARERILEEHWPLGRILKESGMSFTSRPSAYLRMASDKLINEVLQLTGAQVLYGRRNTLFDSSVRPLAEIVEILPSARRGTGEKLK